MTIVDNVGVVLSDRETSSVRHLILKVTRTMARKTQCKEGSNVFDLAISTLASLDRVSQNSMYMLSR
jgi:hypothetical protein